MQALQLLRLASRLLLRRGCLALPGQLVCLGPGSLALQCWLALLLPGCLVPLCWPGAAPCLLLSACGPFASARPSCHQIAAWQGSHRPRNLQKRDAAGAGQRADSASWNPGSLVTLQAPASMHGNSKCKYSVIAARYTCSMFRFDQSLRALAIKSKLSPL